MSQLKVTKEQVQKILSESFIDDLKMGNKTTVVTATLPNGFVIVESSSCVDPGNYDHELGKSICMKRIEDKIWALEGYVLQSKMAGPVPVLNTGVNVVQIARVCHEVNKAYCVSIGDLSQPNWQSAPDWQKASAINGVIFHIDHPDSKPSDSHDNWLAEKRAAGWKYGPFKDPDKKEHPCFVPYEELPHEQQVKDRLFIAVVRAMTSL